MDIIADKISLIIKGNEIFKNMDISLEGSGLVAIVGKSGSGKTSLLNCLGLIQRLNEGEVTIDNETYYPDTNDKIRTRFWKDKAAFIYQDYGIIDGESVCYNVSFSNKKEERINVYGVLEKVGLEDKINVQASCLSGGEKQRVAIARAIFKNARFIFADEPTASLDTINRQLVINLMKACAIKGAMVIIATHDENLAKECDVIIDMDKI